MNYVSGAVDVIIPAYKPDEKLIRIVELLNRQTYPVRNINIVNTEKKYWEAFEPAELLEKRFDNVSVSHIDKNEFDHGKTRKTAAEQSDAEYIIMMTQDAVVYDETLVNALVEPLKNDTQIAVSFARQLACQDATETEKYIRQFNYPNQSMVKGLADINKLGIKTYFCSNVCAAYNHRIYDELGGFVSKTIFNEDMIFAGTAVKAGYKIMYAAQAKVVHSHNLSGREQLHRNFDLAVSQVEHPEIFEGLKSEGEGLRLVKDMAAHLKSIHKLYLMPGFVCNCGCRYIGYKLGRNFRKLPHKLILKLTSNEAYWL